METLVSIIIPVYNAQNTIERAIISATKQSHYNIQVIVIDDYSTDNTPLIVNKLAEIDSRIFYFRHTQNLGVAAARNLGCSKARGEYIAFLDSDDEWHHQKLQLQLKYIQDNKADLCYTGYKIFDEKKARFIQEYKVPIEVNYEQLLEENIICCSTVLIRSNLLGENPFVKKYFHEDFILWLRILREGNRAIGLNKCLVNYSLGGRSSNKMIAAKYRWLIYTECEKISLNRSIYYFFKYILNGLNKYYLYNKKEVSK